jgi:hypothetical protein
MELYSAGAVLLGLAYLYTQSQKPVPPPVVVRNTDSYMMNVDLMQKKQWLYGGNPSANLPIGIQNRKLPNYDGLSKSDILTQIRQNFNNIMTDTNLAQGVLNTSVHGGMVVQPTSQNGFTMQTTMHPGAPRALVVEPYSRSGFSSNTSAVSTTALGQPALLKPM